MSRAEGGPTSGCDAIAHNRRVVQADSVAMGVVNSVGPYLSVFLVRLGANGAQVGLLTALPGIAGVLLAIPIGRWLQRRRNIVPWYSGARLVAQLVYGVIGVAVLVAPQDQVVNVALVLWAVSTIPNTLGQVAFPIVMDGAAGHEGRYELLSRRWSIMGLVTATTVVAVGQALGRVPFPANYAVFFAAVSGAALLSYWFSHQIRIPDQGEPHEEVGGPFWLRIKGLIHLVQPEASFMRYELRAFVTTAGVGLVTPLLPLFYVVELHAPDRWIGIIAAGQSAGALVGYMTTSRLARRNAHKVLIPALVASAFVPLALAFVHHVEVVAILSLASGFAAAAASLALFDELMQRVPPKLGVTFSAVDQSAQNIALTTGPMVGGLLAAAIGIRMALVVAAIFSGMGCVMFARDRRNARRATMIEL